MLGALSAQVSSVDAKVDGLRDDMAQMRQDHNSFINATDQKISTVRSAILAGDAVNAAALVVVEDKLEARLAGHDVEFVRMDQDRKTLNRVIGAGVFLVSGAWAIFNVLLPYLHLTS